MLTTWLDLAETGDIILVYFSGHGLEIEAESYIVPSDTKLSNPALTAIPIEVVKDQMRRSKASKKILILDACHSGEGKATAKMGSILQRTLDDAEGMVTLASCGLNESSYEMKDKPHGAFTYFLMEALKGRGTTDRDQDGLISVSEVNRYVYEQTRRWAARSSLKQRPKFVASVQGEIILAEKMSPSAEVKLRLHRPSATQLTRPAVPTQPSTSTLASTIIGEDGAKMVLIPAGIFQMSSNDGEDDEKPSHTVYVDAFYMDKYEVTNAQYRKFMQVTGHRKPRYWNDSRFNQPSQPVVGVRWDDATAYARWVAKRLPTEAEWEKAARGGLEGRKYPWGDTIDSSKARYGQDWSTGKPTSVGSYSANGYGLYDMAGNVWEWCADWYDENYYTNSPVNNPQGPDAGNYRVLRGGAWSYYSSNLRVAYRNGYFFPNYRAYNNGFRCVSGFPTVLR